MKHYQKDALLDIVYPVHCPVCGQILHGSRSQSLKHPPVIANLICKPCFFRLPFVLEQHCMVCGRPLDNPLAERCDDCKRYPHYFEEARAVFSYKDTVQQALYQLKYRGRREYARFFAASMAYYLSTWIRTRGITAIVPIPLHKSRYKIRTYNQAEEIAIRLGEHLNIPVYPDLLIRKKKTIAQKDLSRSERMQNLAGAFQVNHKYLAGGRMMRILLVDDIYTTGSTVDAASAVLLAAGCAKVFVGAVAVTG